MGFFKNLILSVTEDAALAGLSAAHGYATHRNFDGTLTFVPNKTYDNVFVYSARRDLMQRTMAELTSLYPTLLNKAELKKARAAYKENQGKIRQKVIAEGHDITTSFKKQLGIVWNYRGREYDEGILMWIKNPRIQTAVPVHFDTYWDKIKGGSYVNELKENDLIVNVPGECVFMDMTAISSVQSSKNLVLTKVQGRDFSRKELISNGDFQFSISGKVVSNFPDIYPHEGVSRLVKLMQYKGVIQVYGLLFEQLNVTQVLVKDFHLTQNMGFKNEQPYSFTCVAVEPDSEAEIVEDTLTGLNLSIVRKNKTGWAKLLDTIKDQAIKQAANTMEILTSEII